MKITLAVFTIFLLIQLTTAPPPRRIEPKETHNEGSQEKGDFEDFGLEYNRYLREVIDLLESDPEFKKKLEEAQEVDIRNGQIAKELEFVDHKVRTKLDEVKRQEIERLRHLAQKQYELSNGLDVEHAKVSSEHLDHANPHTFEMEDLKKLIAKVSSDLSEADEKRRREFKEYEMQKEFEKQEKLKHLEGSEREAFEKQLKENETKHKQHERLHQPGSRQQLEEVWEKQDHMENQEFDPKVFFQLHDLDGNGFWDHNEVKALFLKELDKMYEAKAPEDDMRERMEEMERMREHVFREADKNKDGLISYEEFLEKTKQPEFEKDPGWESLDQKPVYTHEEYLEFERRRQQEVQRMIEQGLIPPQPVFNAPYHGQAPYAQYHPLQMQGYPGGHAQGNEHHYPANFQNIPQQHHPQGQQYQQHPQGLPYQQQNPQQGQQFMHQPVNPGSHQSPNSQQNQPGQAYQHQQAPQAAQPHQNVAPPQQPHQNVALPQQPHQNQAPPQQPHQNQAPPQQPVYKQPDTNHVQQSFPKPKENEVPLAHQPQQGHPPNYQQQPQAGPNANHIPADQFHELNLKYSKSEGGDRHPNVINSQYKTPEQNNAKPSKTSK